jgi:hypothetical protein
MSPVSHHRATKKQGGSTKNKKGSLPKYLGAKMSDGQLAFPGQVLVTQRGTNFHPGHNVGVVSFLLGCCTYRAQLFLYRLYALRMQLKSRVLSHISQDIDEAGSSAACHAACSGSGVRCSCKGATGSGADKQTQDSSLSLGMCAGMCQRDCLYCALCRAETSPCLPRPWVK